MSTQVSSDCRSLLMRLINAIISQDCSELEQIAHPTIEIYVPGSSNVHITQESKGRTEVCSWIKAIHANCGTIDIQLTLFFENVAEVRAVGYLTITHPNGQFKSPCSIYARTDNGQVSTFELLLDTHALEEFRTKYVVNDSSN